MNLSHQRERIIPWLVLFVIAAALSACNKTIRFDSAGWKKAGSGSGGPFVRLQMADSLVESRALTGKTKQEILEMLGEPSESGAGQFPEYDLVYWLGPERSLISIDSEWLGIKLDEAGRVKHYKLERD